ncbi:Hypothetical protein D9617_13g100860 [Elsinoe fawcettii]|nr:Hypothetical protein D9617_13g100860 [Elsinoe fawcettii]
MPKYDYNVAMGALNEADKGRCLAAYFSMDNPNASVRPIIGPIKHRRYPDMLYILRKPPPRRLHLKPVDTTREFRVLQTSKPAAQAAFNLGGHVVNFFQTNWAVATKSFGAASEGSMRTMIGSAMKKVKDAGGEIGPDGTATAAPATTAAAKKGAGARKRKAAATEEEDAPNKKPATKGRGRKNQSAVAKDEGDADPGDDKDVDVDDNVVVKGEANVEDDSDTV